MVVARLKREVSVVGGLALPLHKCENHLNMMKLMKRMILEEELMEMR